jgi:hypothetical protein
LEDRHRKINRFHLGIFLYHFLIRKGCKPRFTTTSGCKFKCKFECTNKKYKTGYWRDKRRGRFAYTVNKDPKQIQIEIMEHGPVLAVMNYYPELLSYKSGICSCVTFAFCAKIIPYFHLQEYSS